jgi:hypothetical protein
MRRGIGGKKLFMKHTKDYTLLALFIPLVIAVLSCLPACNGDSASTCPFEGLECPNAQEAMGEYQITLEMEGAYIYDGNRFVGYLPFDSTQAFEKLMIKDNE